MIMVLIDNTNNNDFKNIVFESKFILYNLIKHDKHISSGILIR